MVHAKNAEFFTYIDTVSQPHAVVVVGLQAFLNKTSGASPLQPAMTTTLRLTSLVAFKELEEL